MVEEKANADWIKVKPAELEKIIVDLHKEGNTPAKIGTILRDKHGVPKAKLLGKRITQILIDNKENPKTEKAFVVEKMEYLSKHIGKHKHDYTSKRSFTKKQWVVNKLDKQAAAQ